MLEPTWMPMIARAPRAVEKMERSNRGWLVEVAPYAVAAVWVTVTLTAVIGAATGHREMLDWCRSDTVLAGAGPWPGSQRWWAACDRHKGVDRHPAHSLVPLPGGSLLASGRPIHRQQQRHGRPTGRVDELTIHRFPLSAPRSGVESRHRFGPPGPARRPILAARTGEAFFHRGAASPGHRALQPTSGHPVITAPASARNSGRPGEFQGARVRNAHCEGGRPLADRHGTRQATGRR